MRMTTNFSRAVDLRELPLCSSYLSVHMEALLMHVRQPGSTQELSVHWALGALADGQLDILGVWLELGEGDMLWRAVFADLKVRGVETMRFLTGIDPAVIGASLFESYPRTVALTSIGRSIRRFEADLIVTPRLHRIVHRAEDAAHQLGQRLRQALDGHTCFNDGEAAVSFVAETLMRAERDLGSLAGASSKPVGRRGSNGLVTPSTSVAGH